MMIRLSKDLVILFKKDIVVVTLQNFTQSGTKYVEAAAQRLKGWYQNFMSLWQ